MNILEKFKSSQIQAPFFSLSKTFQFKFFISAFWLHSASTHQGSHDFQNKNYS